MTTTPTATPAPVTWFEIASGDPAATRAYYGELFGWSFEADAADGMDYTIVLAGEAEGAVSRGGIRGHGGAGPSYGVVVVQVPDVAATCRRAEQLGGKVLIGPVTNPDGLSFAHLLDAEGVQVGIWCPPPA